MLTYIEPCGWCSSSISSIKCPSNVNKSTEPCPNLSSSLASTSLISNSDSISISTDSLSFGKRKEASRCLVRSSLDHPDDYYTTKRIDQLHERMDDIQISSFLKFINYHLSLKKDNENLHINDLVKDLSNGHILIDLIEILSSTKLKREHGRTRFHSLTNVQYVLDYLKLRMQHINIFPHEIVSGNRKQILALLWIIMKIFNFSGFRLSNKNCFVENTLLGFGQDRSIILKWLNQILNQSLNTQKIYIKDFYIQTWSNGYYLSIILKYLIPLSIKYLTLKSFDYLKELDQLNSFDKQHFQICLNLSNYCFNTLTIIDDTDKTEKSLFKYFTELQQNILIILKTNHIGKLIQNNPYTKQILDTVIQTTEHSSHIINDNEQYLVCIEDEKHDILNSMGQSTSSSDDTDELVNLRTVEKSRLFNNEQQKMKLKRKNRWEKIENLQSNSHMVNGHNKISKEEQVEELTDTPQQLNGTADKLDQPALLVEEIEQESNVHVKPDQTTITNQDLQQYASATEQPTVAAEETEQMTVTNVENHLNGKLEQPIVEVQEPQQFIGSNEENNYEQSEQITTSQEDIEQPDENKNSTVTDEKLEQPATEEPQQQQIIRSNEEDKQSIDEHEKLEQTVSSVEEIEQSFKNEQSTATFEEQKQLLNSNEKVEQSNVEIELSEQTTSTISENKPSFNINEKLEQSIVEIEGTQQIITSNEENDKSTIEHKKLEQPTENNSFYTTNERFEQPTSEETLQPVISNQEAPIISVENNHYVITNEKLEQPTIEESSQFVLLNGENEQNAIKNSEINSPIPTNMNGKLEQSTIVKSPQSIITSEENEAPVASNEILEQPIVKLEETKQFTVKHEKLDQSSAPIEKPEQFIANKPLESPPCVVSDKKTEQTPVTIVKNNPIAINEKLEQSTIKESPQAIISSEKTIVIPVENKPSIMTSKKLEKPVVIGSQQPVALNGQINKSTTTNKESTATTKKSASSIQEKNQHSATSNEQLKQSIIIVKEPVQTAAATTFKGVKYSDIVNKQSPKTNNQSLQGTAAFKKQEHSTVSKKKPMSIEETKQSLVTAEETDQVPFTTTVKELEQSEVSLKKQEQSTAAIEESCASAISNEETKKSATKNKKSRRSNAKKGKAKNSSIKTENPQQPVVNSEEEEEEEEIEPPLPPLNLTNIVQEQKPSNIESESPNSSTIPKTSNDNTSINNENSQNSSAVRSRKSKKKKTAATTALIEKSSFPIIPTTTPPNRNLFVVIKECIYDRKIIAFKCVIILVCLCFSIIIIILSHK